jgi:hypothetical protein
LKGGIPSKRDLKKDSHNNPQNNSDIENTSNLEGSMISISDVIKSSLLGCFDNLIGIAITVGSAGEEISISPAQVI